MFLASLDMAFIRPRPIVLIRPGAREGIRMGQTIGRMALAILLGVYSIDGHAISIVNQPTLPRSARTALLEAAIASCAANGSPIAAAFSDQNRIITSLLSADAVPAVAIEAAQRKARTAALIGRPSGTLASAESNAPFYVGFLRSVEPSLVTFAGGVPIFVDGHLVGAIGVGGASNPAADEICANEAVRKEVPDAR